MTSVPSWKSLLRQKLSQRTPHNIAVLGIGQELCGDDAAGVLVARRLRRLVGDSDQRLVVDAGLAPENCSGLLRRFRPDFVILVDAAYIGETLGSVRLVNCQAAEGFSASTHTLPLNLLCSYLIEETGCDIALVGIQAGDTQCGQATSQQVKTAARRVARVLAALLCPAEQPQRLD